MGVAIGVAMGAAVGFWSVGPAAGYGNLGASWFHQPQFPGPIGDFSPSERAALRAVDPGVEGGARAVGAADTRFGELVMAHGDEGNPEAFGYVPRADWERRAGVKIIDEDPVSVSGAKVVVTDRGLMPAPLVWTKAAWKLEDRPRRFALLVIEMMEDYRPYLGYLVPSVQPVWREFQARGMPVFYSNWARRPGDGLYGALDRAYGCRGVRAGTNVMYTYQERGIFPMEELMPTREEQEQGHMVRSIHLNKFADLDVYGQSILVEKVRALGVDTIVLTGGGTDACVISTALHAVDAMNLDVVLLTDALGTATPNQKGAMDVLAGLTVQLTSGEFVSYLRQHSGSAAHLLPPATKVA
uniref:Isochorismatase-like domain-containing protein n=1 Tax=Zooxanthella nutricula TaxID=1333877 RepID=A0A7S2PD54_9DINO